MARLLLLLLLNQIQHIVLLHIVRVTVDLVSIIICMAIQAMAWGLAIITSTEAGPHKTLTQQTNAPSAVFE